MREQPRMSVQDLEKTAEELARDRLILCARLAPAADFEFAEDVPKTPGEEPTVRS
jgi:hypothetical protein